MTQCRKEICGTCLFKEPIPATPSGNSNHKLPTRSRFVRATVRAALWLHHAHPFVAATKKSVSCREAQGLVTELWFLLFVTMQWLCSQLCYETAANQRTLVEIELLATVGWKWGCQPFSCRCWQNVTHCRKEICGTCLFKTSITAIPFWNSKHPLPARSLRFLRAVALSTSSALCLHYACERSHPLVEDSGFVSHAEKHRFGHGVVVSKVCYRILECVFPIRHVDYGNVSGLSF